MVWSSGQQFRSYSVKFHDGSIIKYCLRPSSSFFFGIILVSGKFWQQMLAERAVQGACGPESRVKVFLSEEDISLEFCDAPNADSDCVLTKDGKPVRHVRLDCR